MAADSRRSRAHLSTALAQRIVEELAPALQENLNLMDADGFIIASRDVARIGTLHPGAREAAARNEVVTVHDETAREGERPGLNLPLEYRGRVIGVVGVTGSPEKVRSLAPVLRLTIALLFEREAELVGESQRDAADRDLLARLVHGSKPDDALQLLEQRLPALHGPWVLAACIADGAVNDTSAVARLRRYFGAGAVVASLRGVIWVLVGDVTRRGGVDGNGGPHHVAAHLAREVASLVPEYGVVHSSTCGTDAELVHEAGNLAVLSARREVFVAGHARPVAELQLRVVATHLPAQVVAGLSTALGGLTAGERETLAAYLKSGSAAKLSRSVFTHRNTVRRRLAAIAARTGLDLRVPEQAAVLALALAAESEIAPKPT